MLTGYIYESNLSRIRYEFHRQSLISITRDISRVTMHQPFEQSEGVPNASTNVSARCDVQILEVDDVRSSRSAMFVCSQDKPSMGIGGTKQSILVRRHASSTYWCRAYYGLFGTIIRWKLSEPADPFAKTCRVDRRQSDKPEADSFYVHTICILPPAWASLYGYNLRSEKTNGLSTRSLSTFHIIPLSSPIFELVKKGQLDEVKRLFKEHEASAFDVDPFGCTLLHVS